MQVHTDICLSESTGINKLQAIDWIAISWPPKWMWEKVTERFDPSTSMWSLNTTQSSRAMWPLVKQPHQLEITTVVMIIKIIKIKQVTKRSHQVWPWIIRFLMHSKASNNKLPWKQKFRRFSCRQNLKETHCFSSGFSFQYGVCNELLIIVHYAIRVLHLFTYK